MYNRPCLENEEYEMCTGTWYQHGTLEPLSCKWKPDKLIFYFSACSNTCSSISLNRGSRYFWKGGCSPLMTKFYHQSVWKGCVAALRMAENDLFLVKFSDEGKGVCILHLHVRMKYESCTMYIENYSSYRVRTKVLTERQTDGRTNLIPIGHLPSGGP